MTQLNNNDFNSEKPEIPDSSGNFDNQSDPQQTMGKGMMAIAWILAIVILTWIFGMWEQDQYNPNRSPESVKSKHAIEVSLQRNRQGHYLANGSVNQVPVTFILDTGATVVAIPGELQQSLGLISGQAHFSHTANGTTKAYATRIDQLKIGEITLYDVQASIIPTMQGREILLGMSVLKQLEFSQKGNHLTLRQLN
jgi:aspartyl protease family protein